VSPVLVNDTAAFRPGVAEMVSIDLYTILKPQNLYAMYRIMCALFVLTLIAGCEKHTHQPDKKSMEELLTAGKWLLIGFGYDDDQSGSIEFNENLINECQKDNTNEYFKNGNGVHKENQTACVPGPDSEFEWKFIDNEKAIEIEAQRFDIKTLNKQELHFVIHLPYVSPDLHTMYRKQ
jgi:hypothetical protein